MYGRRTESPPPRTTTTTTRSHSVIVEFDVPGHAASWCTGYPDVCPSASCLMPLNVANNATFTLIDSVLSEVTGRQQYKGLFPDDFVHLGGDEVNTDCWTSTPSVAAWLKKMNFTGDQGYAYFVNRAAGIAFAQERQVIQWVEVWEHFGKNLVRKHANSGGCAGISAREERNSLPLISDPGVHVVSRSHCAYGIVATTILTLLHRPTIAPVCPSTVSHSHLACPAFGHRTTARSCTCGRPSRTSTGCSRTATAHC